MIFLTSGPRVWVVKLIASIHVLFSYFIITFYKSKSNTSHISFMANVIIILLCYIFSQLNTCAS